MIIDKFIEYTQMVYHVEPDQSEQMKQIKMAFYAGVQTMLSLSFENISTEPGCTQEDVNYVKSLIQEIQEFSIRKASGLE